MRITIVLTLGLLALTPTINAQVVLEHQVEAADVVVVGTRTTPALSADGLTFPVTVARVLKGDVGVSDVLQVSVKLRQDRRGDYRKEAGTSKPTCALFPLRKTLDGWAQVSGVESQLDSVEIPLSSCVDAPSYAGAATPLDRAAAEVLESLKSTPTAYAGWIAIRRLRTAKSAFLDEATKRAATLKQPAARAVALAWRIENGDATSLNTAAQLLRKEPDPILILVVESVIGAYVNPDPVGIHALGAVIQLDPQVYPKTLREQAAYALRMNHTREAVPYLIMLLSTKDPDLHITAISGLSEHVAGMRATKAGPDNAKAFDEAFNPARKAGRTIPNEQYLHVGPFRNPDEEALLVEAWKAWWSHEQTKYPAAILLDK